MVTVRLRANRIAAVPFDPSPVGSATYTRPRRVRVETTRTTTMITVQWRVHGTGLLRELRFISGRVTRGRLLYTDNACVEYTIDHIIVEM